MQAAYLLSASSGGGSAHRDLDLTVQDKHHRRSDGTKSVSPGSLEKSGDALLLRDLGEAIHGALVEPLSLRLLRLHLQTTTDSVHRIRCITSSDSSGLCNGEDGSQTSEVGGVVSVRVDIGQRVIHTEVHATVRDDTGDGHTEPIVQAHHTGGTLHRLDQAVGQTRELALAASDIRCKAGTGIIQRIDNAQRTSTGKTTRSHVNQEEFAEVSLLVKLGEEVLDDILEGEVERLGREVTENVHEVTTPESGNALLRSNTGEAVDDSGVTLDLAGADQRIGILSLDDQLDTLDRSSGSLGNGTGDTSGGEVRHEGHNRSFLLGHFVVLSVGI